MTIKRKTNRPATYQDVLDAPEYMVAEVIGGVLYTFRGRHRPT